LLCIQEVPVVQYILFPLKKIIAQKICTV